MTYGMHSSNSNSHRHLNPILSLFEQPHDSLGNHQDTFGYGARAYVSSPPYEPHDRHSPVDLH